jgi:ABC-2 type transport system ATP-binding protein
MNNSSPAIEINDLRMVYSDLWGHEKVRALDGISFDVKRGEIFGFLGPNGAGKTTAIHILMNFIYPTGGSAKIFGLPVTDSNCRRSLGFLPELFSFDRFLKGRKLLRYLGALSGIPKPEIDRRGRELLKFFDMEDAINRKVKTYSKGMTQKIGLAQAMISDPDLLILDEPTSGMDPIAKSHIKHKFQELKSRGKTVFLSTHILSDVQQIADRVAIINKGKLIKIDTVENLLKKSDDTEIVFSLDGNKIETLKSELAVINKADSAYSAMVSDKKQKADLIAKLSSLGADIISITPPRSDLEEIFMQLVENGS